MAWIVGKREQEIIKVVNEYLKTVSSELKAAKQLLKAYLSKDTRSVETLTEAVRLQESNADSLRRKVESMMYSGAFLPNFRGDLLGILESADKVANRAEYFADILELQTPDIPDWLEDMLIKELNLSVESYELLMKAVENLFQDLEKAAEYVIETEKKEHETDIVERELIKKIFSMDISLAQKMELKELVQTIADISDRAEDCSDRVEIVLMKRRV